MSADLLRRAADRLDQVQRGDTYVRVRPGQSAKQREFAGGVVLGYHEIGYLVGVEILGAQDVTVDAVPFGPQLAGPLAAWLRAAADHVDNALIGLLDAGVPEARARQVVDGSSELAAAVARAILGEQS